MNQKNYKPWKKRNDPPPPPRFDNRFKSLLNEELEKLLNVVNVAWEFDSERDLLLLDFFDEPDVFNARVEFAHPNSALAFIEGYRRGYKDVNPTVPYVAPEQTEN